MEKEFRNEQTVFVFTNRCVPHKSIFMGYSVGTLCQISTDYRNIVHTYDVSEVFATELEAAEWLLEKAKQNLHQISLRK